MGAHDWPPPAVASQQREIQYCRGADGACLAFGLAGAGPPVVAVGAFASHLALDHEHPVLRAGLAALQREFTVLRYDERGHGLSRGGVGSDDLATRVLDLEAVVNAAGLDRFAIFAAHLGGPVGIAYSALNPRRVTHLILTSTFARGPALVDHSMREAFLFAKLLQEGWGGRARTRRVLSAGIFPGAREETLAWLDDAQPTLGSAETLAASYWNQATADASIHLSQVVAPTLVVHSRDDILVEISEAWRVAAAIPTSRLLSFSDGGNLMPEHGPNWQFAVQRMAAFVTAPGARRTPDANLTALSSRERQVLQLLASGMSNEQIAASEYLSIRTVERHVSNVYRKLHLSGSSSRARAVAVYFRQGEGTTL